MQTIQNPLNSVELLYQGLNQNQIQGLKKELKDHNLDWNLQGSESLSVSINQKSVKIFLFRINPARFQEDMEALIQIHKENPGLTLLVMGSISRTEQVSCLINQAKVFAVIDEKDSLIEILRKAYEASLDKSQYHSNLQKLKTQNKQLETLNQNLEELVHERTKKDFEANKKAELSVKRMRSILAFIKSISRSHGIQDLMDEVRNEFRRFRGVMPPVFALKKDLKEIQFFYFQGKQFTEKTKWVSDGESFLKANNKSGIRSDLGHFFGRPYGSVIVHDFDFQSTELKMVHASMIFEHSLGLEALKEFQNDLNQRLSIVNMALENILLRKSLEDITKQWAETFNKMKDPIIIVKQDYRISLSNGEYHNKKDKICYQNFASQDKPCQSCPMIQTLSTGKPHSDDIHVGGKVYRVHSYPIRLMESDSVDYVINQYVDISQSINLQSQVIQSEKMAAIGLLAGNIAHELNNPLTGIHSLSELLLDDFDKQGNSYRDLTEIREAAARCQRIIKDLLDFSSVGNDSRVQNINVNNMVSKTLPLLKMAMRSLNSEIRLWPKPLFVRCNPQLLQQVIFNLVSNACQAMEDGDLLTVMTGLRDSWVEIMVRDTGSGIPQEVRKFIFDPFFTTKKEGKGTGLGLSLSQSVIEKSGGNLKLNEDYTQGTEFIISLPVMSLL